jgi:hypothetical protein
MIRYAPLLTALLLLTACSDPEPSSNNDTADMGADAAPDLVVADMRPAPTGPQDCAATEWYSTAGPACRACPAPALDCAALILSISSIDKATDTVSFDLDLARLEPASVTLRGQAVRRVPLLEDPNNPGGPGYTDYPPELVTLTMTLDEARANVLLTPPEVGEYISYTFEAVEVVDKCGVTTRFAMGGELQRKEMRVVAPLNCMGVAP